MARVFFLLSRKLLFFSFIFHSIVFFRLLLSAAAVVVILTFSFHIYCVLCARNECVICFNRHVFDTKFTFLLNAFFLLSLLLLLLVSTSLSNEIFYERELTHIRTYSLYVRMYVSMIIISVIFFFAVWLFFFLLRSLFLRSLLYIFLICLWMRMCFQLPYLRIIFMWFE